MVGSGVLASVERAGVSMDSRVGLGILLFVGEGERVVSGYVSGATVLGTTVEDARVGYGGGVAGSTVTTGVACILCSADCN